MTLIWWNVRLNGKLLESVPYNSSYKTADEVKKSLVQHDGYDPAITVCRQRPKSLIIRDYYVVSIPGDLSDNMEDLASQAITEARERAKLYCVPAEWSATPISGEIGSFEVKFRVVRRRRRVS